MEDITAGKHGGNAQSTAAFKKAKYGFSQARQDVVDLLKQHPDGLTCKEMSALLDRPMHKLSGRVTELKEMGVCVATTVRDGGRVIVLTSIKELA